MNEHELVTPTSEAEWRAYHDIRRRVLFEARGRFGVYDETRADEHVLGHHPKLLLHRGEPIGVVRIDIDSTTAMFRRLAVREDVQRRGHGRVLLSLAQQFARSQGCERVASSVARDAVGFYQRCGFATESDHVSETAGQSVFMTKSL